MLEAVPSHSEDKQKLKTGAKGRMDFVCSEPTCCRWFTPVFGSGFIHSCRSVWILSTQRLLGLSMSIRHPGNRWLGGLKNQIGASGKNTAGCGAEAQPQVAGGGHGLPSLQGGPRGRPALGGRGCGEGQGQRRERAGPDRGPDVRGPVPLKGRWSKPGRSGRQNPCSLVGVYPCLG